MARRVRSLDSLALWVPLTVLCFALSACTDGSVSANAKQERPLVIGFSPIFSTGDWMGANVASVREAARAANMEVRMEDARNSQETQVAALRSFVRQRVDVIVFAPVVEPGWDLVLREIELPGWRHRS